MINQKIVTIDPSGHTNDLLSGSMPLYTVVTGVTGITGVAWPLLALLALLVLLVLRWCYWWDEGVHR